MALMLLNANATVTVCHVQDGGLPDLGALCLAPAGLAAARKPRFVQVAGIKNGGFPGDVGYHPGGIGDIDLESSPGRASAYDAGSGRCRPHDHRQLDRSNRPRRGKGWSSWTNQPALKARRFR